MCSRLADDAGSARPASGEAREPAEPALEGCGWDPSVMVSYAQYGEDVLLHRLFPPDHAGFYVDVGANHPTHHSVTRHFFDRGWRGINIEPVSRICALLREQRPGDVSLDVALSDHEGLMTLHEPVDSLGMSTLNEDFAVSLRADGYACVERQVRVTTLAKVCEAYVGRRTIDVLKIDVEGHEASVIRGADWSRWRPRVVLVEATIAVDAWEPVLLGAGYVLATSDGVNRYYLRPEDADLAPRLAAPRWTTDVFVPPQVFEAHQTLEHRFKNTLVGFDQARYALWEARTLLDRAEARATALQQELDRLRAIESGRGRIERGALRLGRLLASAWGRRPRAPAAIAGARRAG